MAIVLSILSSLGCVLLCGGLCFGVLNIRFFQKSPLSLPALSLAVLVGFFGGYVYMYQRFFPGFPPADVSLWWVYALPVLGILAYWPHALLTTLLSGLYAYLLTGPLRQYEWSLVQSILFTFFVAVIMGVSPQIVNRVLGIAVQSGEKGLRWLWPWVMAITSLGSAGVFMLSSSASLSQQTLFLVVLQGLTALVFFFHSDSEVSLGLVIVNLWLLFMLWLNMLLFAELPYSALVGLFALFSPLLLRFKSIASASLFIQFLTVGIGSTFCLGVAAAFSIVF